MAGLSLRAGMGMGGNQGLTPVPAAVATGPRKSTLPAWGYTAGMPGPRTGMFGGIAVGFISGALLLWLWWSLPR